MSDVRNKTRVMPERSAFQFPPVSCVLGDDSCKYMFECRIMNHQTGFQDRVMVHASNFGEVKWCLMGYLKVPLVITDTTIRTTKHFVLPNDIGQRTFVAIVIRVN